MCAGCLAIDREKLLKFSDGYFAALGVNAKPETLHECIKDSIGADWWQTVQVLGRVKWEDPTSVIIGFTAAIIPALDHMSMVLPCDKEEINALYEKVKKMLRNEEWFTKKLTENIATLSLGLKAFYSAWMQDDFATSGRNIGGVVNWVFIEGHIDE